MKNKKRLYFLSIFIIIFSISMITINIIDGFNQKKQHQEIKELYDSTQEEKTAALDSSEEALANMEYQYNKNFFEKFQPLITINQDFIGWITLPGTLIDYPIVQKNDNEFYLDHDFEGKKNKAGSIFMDFRNEGNGNDINTILYGHNMKNGSMFQNLMRYKDQDFLNQNKYIYLDTAYGKITYEIFSVYVTDTSFYYISTSFGSDKQHEDFLSALKKRSLFHIDTKIATSDQILTLSTCSYEFNDARFVVHGKRIKNEL